MFGVGAVLCLGAFLGMPAQPGMAGRASVCLPLQREAESYMTEIESVGQAYEDAQVGVPCRDQGTWA